LAVALLFALILILIGHRFSFRGYESQRVGTGGSSAFVLIHRGSEASDVAIR